MPHALPRGGLFSVQQSPLLLQTSESIFVQRISIKYWCNPISKDNFLLLVFCTVWQRQPVAMHFSLALMPHAETTTSPAVLLLPLLQEGGLMENYAVFKWKF